VKDRIIYGTAKLSNISYGFGSKPKKFNKNLFLKNYINENFNIIEISDRYFQSIKFTKHFHKNKEIHYKIDKLRYLKNFESEIFKKIKLFLQFTKRDFVDVLYLHENNIQIISNKRIINVLEKLKKKKLVKKFGTSIYNEDELKYILKKKIYKVIQIPVNITDTYFLNKYKSKLQNKIVVARSIFLQGTILNKLKNHKKKKDINNYMKKIFNLCKKSNLNYEKLLISFVFNLKNVDRIIIGSINKKNINKILLFSKYKIKNSIIKKIMKLSNTNKKWNKPRNW